MRGLGLVLAAAALAWVGLAGPAVLLGGAGPDLTGPALLVCLAPNLLALGVAGLVRHKSPITQMGVLLASFLVRPLAALGLGVGAYYLFPHLQGRALSLVVWGAVFYLLLLAAESYVVSRQVAGSTAGR